MQLPARLSHRPDSRAGAGSRVSSSP
jgi:hypothetical protein